MSPEYTEAKRRAIGLDEELQALYPRRAEKEQVRNDLYARVFPAVRELLEKALGPNKQEPNPAEVANVEEPLGELVSRDVELAELNNTITAKERERDQAMKHAMALLSGKRNA